MPTPDKPLIHPIHPLSHSNSHSRQRNILYESAAYNCEKSLRGSRMGLMEAMIEDQREEQEEQEREQEEGEEGEYEEQEEQDCIQMIIQLDSQTSIPLQIHPHTNPSLLAKQFCYTNNIDPKVITILAKQIQQLQYRHKQQAQGQAQGQSINSKYGSNKGSRVNGRSSTYSSGAGVGDSVQTCGDRQKQNKQHLSNIPHKTHLKPPTIPEHLEPFIPNPNPDPTNPNTTSRQFHTTNTKYNSRNNTTVISNLSNGNVSGNGNGMGGGDGTGEGVFERLYRNSVEKNRRRKEVGDKERVLQSQQQFRNYEYQSNPQPYSKDTLNQSTTYIHNLSSSNIHQPQPGTQHTKQPTNTYKPQLKIYQKNRKLQKQTLNRNLHLKQQLEELAQGEFTGVPEINPLSRLIVEKLREGRDRGDGGGDGQGLRDSFVRLYQGKDVSKEKMIARTIEYQKKRQAQQLQQCTFHPKILQKSKQQTLNTSRYLLLHEDFYIREHKAQSVKQSQTKKQILLHQPSINEISKKLVKDRSFEDRLVEYGARAERNRERLERESQGKYRPEINKNSRNDKKGGISIGEYLYAKSLEKKAPVVGNGEGKARKSVNKSSENMYQEMKKNAFRYIFTLMDSDQDGLISGLKINILGLDAEVLQILAPLLCEMQQVQIELDQQQFVSSLENLFKTLPIPHKNTLLTVYKNPLRKAKPTPEPSFHPSLNEKSIEIAREVREPGTSLYELGREKEIEREGRLEELRVLRMMMEVQECTFQPNLFYHH